MRPQKETIVIGFAARAPQYSGSVQAALVSRRPQVATGLALLGLLGLSLLLLRVPIDYKAFGNTGYVGIFAITLLASATFVLPVPYLAAIIVGGTFLDPRMVALVAGVAAALGEITGYWVGYKGRGILPPSRWLALLERGMARFGLPVIFMAAAVPNPVFDAVGLIAGATRLPLRYFVLACFFGKTLRFWIIATVGASLLMP
jgi:membrane protein YqaA with SNARE-associated domain